MKNRETIERQINLIYGKLNVLRNIVKTQSPIEQYITEIEATKVLFDDLKAVIDREPFSPGEFNRG